MKNLPVGIQTFRKIIEANNFYVDKTEDIYNLINNNESNFYFLSRPRRFGKSLLISTLEEIFLGNKDLFKDLYIYDKIEWKKHPVIRIDFTGLTYARGIDNFLKSFDTKIQQIASDFGVELEQKDYKFAFQELLKKISKHEKAIILIDEYDKPIVEYIEDSIKREQMKSIVKDFYLVLKESDQYIKFCFLTGVSKFSKISVFSGLNNLTDLTLDQRFSTITGITEEELYRDFDEHIKSLSHKLNKDVNEIKKELKNWYNGYSWDGKNFLYNPFSILSVLKTQQINNYWFESGTPSLLIKLIKEKDIDLQSLENFEADKNMLDSFEIENINVESLLFQTGYLTIKEIIEYDINDKSYILNYPNKEVKESFLRSILNNFSETNNNSVLSAKLYRALNNNNLEDFFKFISNIFSNIPSVIFMSNKEAYYHTIIYLILTLIGVRIKTEVWTNKGRIDAVIETKTNIYIFEFKMSSSKKALKQIKDKEYYEKYLISNKQIILVGVSFNIKKRNIHNWTYEIIKNNS